MATDREGDRDMYVPLHDDICTCNTIPWSPCTGYMEERAMYPRKRDMLPPLTAMVPQAG